MEDGPLSERNINKSEDTTQRLVTVHKENGNINVTAIKVWIFLSNITEFQVTHKPKICFQH